MDPIESFARQIRRAYEGRLKREELGVLGVPQCQFKVEGTHRGRTLIFRVLDGGCLVEGETVRKPTLAFSFNRPLARVDKSITRALPKGAPRAFRVRNIREGTDYPRHLVGTVENQVRALWMDERSGRQLRALRLGGAELLALLPKPMFAAGRPTFYLLHHSPDLTLLDRRLDIIAELFPPPKVSELSRSISATAYGIKLAARSASKLARHQWGGKSEPALLCRSCRTPLHRILTIDTGDPELDLVAVGRRHFPVMYCLNCMSWDVLYIDYAKEQLRIVRQAKESRVNDEGPLDERALTLTPLTSATRPGSKIGGCPTWLQGPAVPQCARCDTPMAFFAQVRSSRELAFGDDGVLYSFVCAKCQVSASLIQSS